MKHLLLTTIAAVVLVGTAFADPIHTAAETGDLAGVQAELDKGVDVDKEDLSGLTPLHYAAREGHKEITDLLLTNGADVNAKNDEGGTPLDWAECCADKKETVDLLRKHGGKTGRDLK